MGIRLFLSTHVHVFLWVFLVCQCGGGAVRNLEGKSERARCSEGKVSLSEENKRDWKSAITVLEIMERAR